jgi:polyisoprenoid-binding protein YceI
MSWQVDYPHTSIQFSARHMMITTVRGQFEKFKIDAHIDEDEVNQIHDKGVLTEDDFINSKLHVQIEAASINTHAADRDAHLRSPDFLNVDKYPYVTFQATGGKKIDEERGKLNGNLTIRDVTRPVTLDVEYLGQAKSPWGTTNAGFNARTKINRKDWGLTWNVALETGGWLVSEDINIEIEIEFTKVPEPAKQPEAAAAAA